MFHRLNQCGIAISLSFSPLLQLLALPPTASGTFCCLALCLYSVLARGLGTDSHHVCAPCPVTFYLCLLPLHHHLPDFSSLFPRDRTERQGQEEKEKGRQEGDSQHGSVCIHVPCVFSAFCLLLIHSLIVSPPLSEEAGSIHIWLWSFICGQAPGGEHYFGSGRFITNRHCCGRCWHGPGGTRFINYTSTYVGPHKFSRFIFLWLLWDGMTFLFSCHVWSLQITLCSLYYIFWAGFSFHFRGSELLAAGWSIVWTCMLTYLLLLRYFGSGY